MWGIGFKVSAFGVGRV